MLLVRLTRAVRASLPEPPVLDPVEAWRLAWQIAERVRGELTAVTIGLVAIWAVSVADAWLGSGTSSRTDVID